MTSENKNKSRLKAKSRILVLVLVSIIVLVGLFGPVKKTLAAEVICGTDLTDPGGFGRTLKISIPDPGSDDEAEKACADKNRGYLSWKKDKITWEEEKEIKEKQRMKIITANEKSAFSEAVSNTSCILAHWVRGTVAGCLLQIAYYTLYMLGSFLLWLAALLFNFLISYTLNSELLRSDFIASSWGIVRDLSNIFFILILLYIAVKIILDIGGSEAKKMIGKVVIIALLINFSMFFTRVVIDSSNILALIFYNKIEPKKTTPDGSKTEALDPNKKKDISGGLTKSFNPAYQLRGDFFEKAGDEIILEGLPNKKSVVSAGVLLGITVISGIIMIFAAYALFVSSLSFLGRLIELFILIIFSPFAFVSSTIPLLKNAEYLGWDNWFKRLLKVAFMAPIFMFFLYFIFLLLGDKDNAPMFSNAVEGKGFWVVLLNLVIPALIILILLMKATKFAKEGSGAIGEAVIKTASVGLGLAGALAIGTAAKGLQAGGGYVGERILRNKKWAEYESAKKEDQTGRFKGAKAWLKQSYGGSLRTIAGGTNADGKGGLVGSSFDLRKGAVSGLLKSAEKVTGLNFGAASKFLLKPDGGHRGDRERAQEKRDKRASSLKVARDELLQQELNETKEKHYKLNNESSYNVNQIEVQIEATKKNRETYRLNSEADKAKLDESKSSLDARGEEKAKTTLEKTASIHKTAQGEAEATDKAATEAYNTATNDIERGAAANARITANTKQAIAKQAEKEHSDAQKAYDKIIDDPEYIKLKAVYDEDKATYSASVAAYQEQTDKIKDLTIRRANIKNVKAARNEDGEIDMAANKEKFAAAEIALVAAETLVAETKIDVIKADAHLKANTKNSAEEKNYDKAEAAFDKLVARGVAVTDSIYIAAKAAKNTAELAVTAINSEYIAAKDNYATIKTKFDTNKADEDEKRKTKEVATAALASAQFGEGQSINDFEDKAIPEAQKKIEDENRERLIANAENFREEYRSGAMRVLRALFTPAGDNKYSRNAAAQKIIEDISKKRV